ncbi:MAG: hypothetical protein HY079_08080 [Elusimicrobia bacterium]|nr:hypothetical protein [Elusimicrobiota bacterium]
MRLRALSFAEALGSTPTEADARRALKSAAESARRDPLDWRSLSREASLLHVLGREEDAHVTQDASSRIAHG